MGPVNLEVRYPKEIDGIAADPQPDWSFDALLLELNSVENKLKESSKFSYPFSKTQTREASAMKGNSRASGAFMMQVLDSELDMDSDDEEEEGHEDGRAIVSGRRFTCEDSFSDSEVSEDDSVYGDQCQLMDKIGFVEGALSELTHEQKLSAMEEMRNQILELERDLVNENEKFASVLARVDKYKEAKREMDRKFDMQYQRRIAEALDNHLTAVQRDHEHKSQIEERRIRDDAVREEARRREKALQEEKVRLEKIKAEAEKQVRIEAERAAAAKSATLEAERKAAEEAAKKKTTVDIQSASTGVAENSSKATGVAENSSKATGLPQGATSQVSESRQSAGNMIRGAENALKLEEKRLQTYTQLAAEYNAVKQRSNLRQEFSKHEQKISRNMRQITGSRDNVTEKAVELIRLITDTSYPQSISIVSFADKFVSLCENPSGSFNRSVYAYGHVIVLVTSRVQVAMDVLLAKLNRVCIYTVPKHIKYSKAAFESTEAYYKAIGYREEEGKLESSDSFIERLGSYMKLYGALVQTEIDRVQNSHGIAHGWAWLARFLNTLPSNLYTAVTLQSFLEIAGFALHRRYKNQFKKLLPIIDKKFLSATQTTQDPKLTMAIVNIRNYLESKQYLKEPEGWQLENDIKSNYCSW